MTADLVAFLRARLDEDQKLAFEAGDGGHDNWIFNPELVWEGPDGPRETVVRFSGSALSFVAAVDPIHGKYGTWSARHIARWDPARVLAEVDAKRRIIAEHERYAAERRRAMGGWDTSEVSPILAALAAVYADHPDYQPEWAPRKES